MQRTYRSILTLILAGTLTVAPCLLAAPSEAELMKEAEITKAEAEKIALEKVPQGKVESAELEKEHGKLVWSFDVGVPNSKNITEIQVDAKTGKIAAVEIETPDHQAMEANEDKPKR